MTRATRLVAAALVLPLATAALASAQSADPGFELSVSYYEPSFDTQVRLDSEALGVGTTLDLEDDLGVEGDLQELRAELAIRLGQRFRLVVDHVALDRTGSASIAQTVQFGDVVYAGNAELDAAIESSHTGVALRFAFVKNPTSEIALSVGATQLDFQASLTGTAIATANGVPVGSAEITEQGEASGPVPMVGLHAAFWMTDRLRIRLDGRYIDIGQLVDEDQWSGSMSEYGIGVEYFVLPWLAVGGGYSGTAIDADFADDDLSGRFDYDFDGLRAGVTLAF
jgi:opacity protein-like surface antigen